MENLLVKSKKFKSLSEMFGIEQGVSLIAGPCSIESYEQMELVAQNLIKNNVRFIRGGAFKPRTSPYDFQGLGLEGLKILDDIRKKYNLLAVSEIMDPRDVEYGIQYLDVIQIGSRNMQNYSLLKEIGKTNHPVLLKRGMMSTVNEFLLTAEYIVSSGNENIIMCERGIRTFDAETRNILDISCIAIIKKYTNLPVVVDISHSLGRKDILVSVVKAVAAMQIDVIMVEVHNNPSSSLSDQKQQLSFSEFDFICKAIKL
jgi:3-deoxy-7-phosphoheptulonate synthase/chorismate mutase